MRDRYFSEHEVQHASPTPWKVFELRRFNLKDIVRRFSSQVLLLTIITIATGCATSEPDPYESINRRLYAFNSAADSAVLKPVAQGYTVVVPSFARTGVSNVFDNLRDPWISVNQLLQGKAPLFANDLSRFFVNTTAGVLGLFDVASKWGLEKHDEDFGQTLGVWGFEPGPYLMVPFWGPSSFRDGIGDIVGAYTFPPFYLENTTARDLTVALWIIKSRADYLEAESLIRGDRYLFIRDAFLQNREFLVRDGAIDDPFLEDF